jgi:hypothetical protein
MKKLIPFHIQRNALRVELLTGRWFSLGHQISSTNKTGGYDICEILLSVSLNTINQTSAQTGE